MHIGQATVTSRSRPQRRSGCTACTLCSAPPGRDFGWGAGILTQCLALPNLRQRADENLRWPINLLSPANATGHAGGKDRNSPSEARYLGSADFAPDQRVDSQASSPRCLSASGHATGMHRFKAARDALKSQIPRVSESCSHSHPMVSFVS
jgi:hypothetical protein